MLPFISAAPLFASAGLHEALRNFINNPRVMLGLWGVLVFFFIVIPAWFALFLHVTTRCFDLKKPFGVAFMTVVLDWVLLAAFHVGLALFGVNHLASADWAASLLATVIAVSVMYSAGFFKSIAVAVVSGLLTALATAAMILGLAFLLDATSPPTAKPPAPYAHTMGDSESVSF